MKNIGSIHTLRTVGFLIIVLALGGSVLAFQSTDNLSSVKKIFIGNFGYDENADIVKEKIRVRLAKSNRFTIVEHEENADAVLTGAARVLDNYQSAAIL